MKTKKSKAVVTTKPVEGSALIANQPTSTVNLEIPIIPPREHVVAETTVNTVRVRRPVRIDIIVVRSLDTGGYMLELPGGKVAFAGARQELYVGKIEDVLQLIAHSIGQTTYEFYEIEEDEWNDQQADREWKARRRDKLDDNTDLVE